MKPTYQDIDISSNKRMCNLIVGVGKRKKIIIYALVSINNIRSFLKDICMIVP